MKPLQNRDLLFLPLSAHAGHATTSSCVWQKLPFPIYTARSLPFLAMCYVWTIVLGAGLDNIKNLPLNYCHSTFNRWTDIHTANLTKASEMRFKNDLTLKISDARIFVCHLHIHPHIYLPVHTHRLLFAVSMGATNNNAYWLTVYPSMTSTTSCSLSILCWLWLVRIVKTHQWVKLGWPSPQPRPHHNPRNIWCNCEYTYFKKSSCLKKI